MFFTRAFSLRSADMSLFIFSMTLLTELYLAIPNCLPLFKFLSSKAPNKKNGNIPRFRLHINNFFKKLDKHGVILFLQENRFPSSSSVHHMVPCVRVLYS